MRSQTAKKWKRGLEGAGADVTIAPGVMGVMLGPDAVFVY